MIRTREAILLARTKLKTRRVRLVILLITMSLLFAGLVFIADVASGTVHSLQDFSKEGFGNRFLVQAHPLTYQQYGDTTLTNQLKSQQDQLIAQKTALAKKLGITYDPKTDANLYYMNQQTGPNQTDLQPILNSSSLAITALNNQNLAIPHISFTDFTKRAEQTGATQVYRSTNSMNNSGQAPGAAAGSLSVLVGGKEDYSTNTNQQQGAPTGVQSIQTLGWNQMSEGLLKPFLLTGQTTAIGSDGSIPIVAPYSAAEQLVGLPKLPATASSAQKLQRLVQVRTQIAGKTAQLCYRNTASETFLQQAIQQQADIIANKGKSDYMPPHLLYNLPSEACGTTPIKSDKRTPDEKTADANQQKFTDSLSPTPAATQGIITLRIVGISPDVDPGNTSISAGGILSTIFSSTIGYGWFSPASAFVMGNIATQAQNGTLADQPLTQQTYYAEFSTLAAATSFIKQTDCYGTGSIQITGNYDPNAEVVKCAAKNKPFTIAPYGNNAGAIADFQHNIWKFLRFVLLAVVVIAVVIMMGTFGKVIADSRRETAVFRSLGASRLAVSQIYLTYTLLVCALVAGLSLTIGTVCAEILSRHLSPGLSVNAVLTYNAHDVHKQFTVAGFNVLYLAGILGLIIGSGLLSALIPLIMNMRRNPIRDMRDE